MTSGFVCPAPAPPYNLPILGNLEIRPKFDGKIDQSGDSLLDSTLGWNDNEYAGFQTILMYNGGKNKDYSATLPIGQARVG